MHLLLNAICNEVSSGQIFQNYIEMLRFLVLRERGQFFHQTVLKLIGDSVDTHPIKLYSLFTRPRYLEILARRKKVQKSDQTPNKTREQHILQQ